MSSTCYIDWSIEHRLTSHDFIIKSHSSCSFRLAYLGNLGESSLRYFPSIVWLNAILLCWKWLSLDISLCSRNKGNPSWAALILDYIASRTDKRCLRRCCSTFCVWFHAERAEQWWTMGERRLNGWMRSHDIVNTSNRKLFDFLTENFVFHPMKYSTIRRLDSSRAPATQLEKALTRPFHLRFINRSQ